jgi:hypothetical protein
MWRSRWIVALGPPLALVTASVWGGVLTRPAAGADRSATVALGGMPDCGPDIAPVAAGLAGSVAAAGAGERSAGEPDPDPAWWRARAVLDEGGGLGGWALEVGTGDQRTVRLTLPPASLVAGPRFGTVLASSDDGRRSSVRIISAGAGCGTVVDLGQAVGRRVIADPAGGFLVHLLDRASRRDLGVWRYGGDGPGPELVLKPVPVEDLRHAGIDRVWTTAIDASPDGAWLAVQSCSDQACLTRLLDRGTGAVETLGAPQGDVVGFAGPFLVTMAHCHGLPCPVLAWSLSDLAIATVADEVVGAAITPDGRIATSMRTPSGTELVIVDPRTARQRDLGSVDDGALPAGPDAPLAGVEPDPGSVGLIGPDGEISIRGLDPLAGPPATRHLEIAP